MFFDAIFQAECLCRQVLRVKLCRSPRWQRTLHHRGLRILALNSLEEREKWRKKSKKTLHRRHTHAESVPVSVRTGMSTDSGDELNLRHPHCRETLRRCMITRTSTTAGTAPAAPSCTSRRNNGHATTLSGTCNCGTPRAALSGPYTLTCTTTGKTTTKSKNWTNPRRRPAQQGHRPPRRR